MKVDHSDQDVNTGYVCELLRNCGVRLERIAVVGDNVDEIAQVSTPP